MVLNQAAFVFVDWGEEVREEEEEAAKSDEDQSSSNGAWPVQSGSNKTGSCRHSWFDHQPL